jgi:parallel beta-helix repeat protein
LINRPLYPSLLLTLTFSACSGGNDITPASESVSTTSSQTSTLSSPNTSVRPNAYAAILEIESLSPNASTTTLLPTPSGIASGETVSLQCGQVYHGTLDLNGKSNVTVNTVGTCGKATITPGKPVSGWTQHRGNIYSAPIDFTPVQVSVSGQPVDAAHWPNRPQTWADSGSGVPDSDLDGATLVYLDNQSVVKMDRIAGSSVNTPHWFYVEGKLWMLDSPGEWAVSDGRLYMWAPDGQSPEGKVWAAPDSNGINADNSNGITIDGVRVFSGVDGISGNYSANLKVLNSEITNNARDGIWASGSRGLVVDRTAVTNSVRNGIDGWYSITDAVVTNSAVTNTGTVGKPKPTDAGIMFGGGSGNRIDNVHVTNSSYHGISVLQSRNTAITNNVVDTACVALTDCGGIYTSAPDRQPLAQRIEGNTVRNVKGSEGIGIYLDSWANGVTVTKNTIADNKTGMVLHNAFDSVIADNTFHSNTTSHINFSQDIGEVRNNQVTNNTFNSTNGEQTFKLETGANLRTFAIFDHNTYSTTNPNEFARTWDGISGGVTHNFDGWRSWIGQDTNSRMNGAQ